MRRPCPPCPPGVVVGLCEGISAGPIAVGDGGGATLTITLTRNVVCTGLLHVVPCVLKEASANPSNFINLVSVTDTQGGSYFINTATEPQIGATLWEISGGPPYTCMQIGQSVLRPVLPGSLSAGDQITLTWAGPAVADFQTSAMAFVLTGSEGTAEPQATFPGDPYHIAYNNGDAYDFGTNPARLNWVADLGSDPTPEHTCAAISAAAFYPGFATYGPAAGDEIGYHFAGNFSMSVALTTNIPAGDTYEPGGTWDHPGTLLVGNYQFLRFVS